jgi:hypothetical protein
MQIQSNNIQAIQNITQTDKQSTFLYCGSILQNRGITTFTQMCNKN